MIRIAICHADKDERHLERLEKLLAPAEKDGRIMLWHRGKIVPGANTQGAVTQGYGRSDAVVLLLSADLLADHAAEVGLALQQSTRGVPVLPVLVRPALLDEHISALRVLPRNRKPITRQPDEDEAWAEVAEAILATAAGTPQAAAPQPPPAMQQQQQQQPQSAEIKILFMGANPTDATRLALDREVKEIGSRIDYAQQRARLPLVQEHAVPLEELQQILLRHKPAILHFSGHGTKDGKLVFLSRSGTGAAAPPQAIAKLFAFFAKKGLRCVILNACFAREQARLIAEHVECVIGIEDEIKDESAIRFTAGFYAGLAGGETVQEAFEMGQLQIDLCDQPHADRLHLLCKPGVDPRTLKLV